MHAVSAGLEGVLLSPSLVGEWPGDSLFPHPRAGKEAGASLRVAQQALLLGH